VLAGEGHAPVVAVLVASAKESYRKASGPISRPLSRGWLGARPPPAPLTPTWRGRRIGVPGADGELVDDGDGVQPGARVTNFAYLPDHEPAPAGAIAGKPRDRLSGSSLADSVDLLMHDAEHFEDARAQALTGRTGDGPTLAREGMLVELP
jgi:hypothetical protein